MEHYIYSNVIFLKDEDDIREAREQVSKSIVHPMSEMKGRVMGRTMAGWHIHASVQTDDMVVVTFARLDRPDNIIS